MERKDLVVAGHPVLVCDEISRLLEIPQKIYINYPFTHICRSISDPNRISGIPFKTLESMAWNERPYQHGFDIAYSYYCHDFTPTDVFRNGKGVNLKPGKLAAAVFPDKDAQQISLIADKWANLLRGTSGLDLSALQHSDNPSEIYILPSDFTSCMRGCGQDRFLIYDDLRHTSILYFVADSYLVGRALLHDEVLPGSIKLMDRIYYNNADTLGLFVQYARKHGYWRKAEQCLGCDLYVNPETEDEVELSQIYIECEDLSNKYDQVPYIDTFCYYHDGMLASSSNISGSRYLTCLHNTDGTDSDGVITEPEFRCSSCGRAMSEDDGIYVNGDRLCEGCGEDYYWCDCCDEYYHYDNVAIVDGEPYCRQHAEQRFTLCERCNDYHENSDCRNVEDYGSVCDDCFYRGDFYTCDKCGEHYKVSKSDSLYLRNLDITVCDNCLDDYAECYDCDNWCLESDLNYDAIGDSHTCDDCYNAIQEDRANEKLEATL